MATPVEELAAEIDKIDFGGGLAPASTPASAEEKATEEKPPTPAPTEKSAEETKEVKTEEQTQTEKPAEGETSTSPESAETKADDRPAIPDSHYRAAIHVLKLPADQAAAKIGALYDADPELALQWLAGCYEQVNATSKQLGELGQRARQLREQPVAALAQPSRKEAVMKELRKKYEDDPIIDLIGELIPDAPVAPRQPAPQPASQEVEVERQVAIRQEINNFFGADEMGVYGDFYGKAGDWQQLTPGQRANRIEVCNRAQAILDGAAFSGMQLNTAEALERAHLEVAAPQAEQFVRERIVKSVTKWAKGVTLKPSGSKTPAPAGGTYSKDQAIQEMGAELKKVFGD
jgi:hypothetical protein